MFQFKKLNQKNLSNRREIGEFNQMIFTRKSLMSEFTKFLK